MEIRVPAEAPDPIDTVVVLEIEGEPDVVEATTAQADDGSIVLHARDATPHGTNIKYEQGSGKDNIGYWTDANDYVSWALQMHAAGTFELELTYACPNPGGSEFVVEVAEQKLNGKVQATGSWTAFQAENIGLIELPKGRANLIVRAKNLVGEGVMNLRSIALTPAKK